MDHIARTLLPEVEQIHTPLILEKRFIYDGLGFWGFPERKGVQPSELWAPRAESTLNDFEKVGFLQNWLFFGFAHEVFGRIIDTPMPLTFEFLLAKEDGKPRPVIDSTYLGSAIAAWLALEEYTNSDMECERAKKILAVVDEVRNVLRAINFVGMNLEYLEDGREFPIAHRVMMSICLLGEQIGTAMEAIYGSAFTGIAPSQYWPLSSRLKKIYLQNAGLCEKEGEAILKGGVLSHSMLVYALLSSQFLWNRDHSRCSESACNAIHNQANKSAHNHAECDCEQVSLSDTNQLLLIEAIKKGHFPMLTIETTPGDVSSTKILLENFDHTKDEAFCIAISHVWADNLGNPKANSMPACQLVKLQDLVNNVVKEYSSKWDSTPTKVGFWIDTLCVPMDQAAKVLALDKMHDIYRDASGVLILDQKMQKTSIDLGWGACLWQMYTSTWDRRLWTLQEGVLNKKNFYAFSDNFWTLEHLVLSYENEPHGMNTSTDEYRNFVAKNKPYYFPQTEASVCRRIVPHHADPVYHTVSNRLREKVEIFERPPASRAVRLIHQFNWRTTSFPSDECICLAILIGFSVTELMKLPEEQRLPTLVQTIGQCPSRFVFLELPKSDIPGWRWMPKTFLNQGTAGEIRGSRSGTLTKDGLLVTLFSLKVVEKPTITIVKSGYETPEKIQLQVEREMLDVSVDSGDGSIFLSFLFGEQDTSQYDGILLLDESFHSVKQCAGLIGTIWKTEEDVVYVKPVGICMVRGRQTVYNMPELSATWGHVETENINRPQLDRHAFYDPISRVDAELLPSRTFCIG